MEVTGIIAADKTVNIRSASAEQVAELEVNVMETAKALTSCTKNLADLNDSLKQLQISKAKYDETAGEVKKRMRMLNSTL